VVVNSPLPTPFTLSISCLPLTFPLQDESLTFQGQLDSLEAEILKHREELHDMQIMNNNAQLYKEAAKVPVTLLCSYMSLQRASKGVTKMIHS